MSLYRLTRARQRRCQKTSTPRQSSTQEFLKLIGKPSDDVAVNMCERCQIDNTDLYADELWQLPGKEIFVWPMEGCPKPS